MVDYDSFEEFRDPVTYDVECDAFDADRPLVEKCAGSTGGPLLDLACGTGRMAIHMALQGYAITGVDVVPEMIAQARRKAAERSISVDWVVAEARTFHLDKQFPFIYMLGNAFQFFLTREDQEALLARVQEHLLPEGWFLFETRNPSPRNLLELRHPEPQEFLMPDGRQLVVTEQQHYDPLTQIQHYTCHRRWLDAVGHYTDKIHFTALRYVFPQEMEALLHYNGLEILARYGNWQQDPLTADSPAMICVCRRRL